jgi:cell division septation protein DedD
MLTLTVGCSTGPISLGLTAAGDAFFGLFGLFGLDSLRKSHADDTFLIEKAVVLEATLHALEVMTLQIEDTTEEDGTTIITGASQASKAPMKFSASIREISSTVTNVSIRAGRGLLKPDHSTAEEIMNQLILRLEKTTSASRSPEESISVAASNPATLPTPTPLKSQYVRETHSTVKPAPYVVQVGSYQTKANADRHVEELRDKKSQAYAVPFDLTDRGRWHRVLIQRFATQEEARRFAGKIMADGLVDLAFPMLLPFAVEVGTKKRAHDASPVEIRLRNEGFYPYVLQVPNTGLSNRKYRILVGAYETPVAAAALSKTLLAARIPNQIVTP